MMKMITTTAINKIFLAALIILSSAWCSAEPAKIKIVSNKAPVYSGNQIIGYVYTGAELSILSEENEMYKVRVWGGKSEFFGWIKKSDIDNPNSAPELGAVPQPVVKLSAQETKNQLYDLLKVPYRTRQEGSRTRKPIVNSTEKMVRTEKIYKKYPVSHKEKSDGNADFSVFLDWQGISGANFILEEKIASLQKLADKAHQSYYWAIKEYIDSLKSIQEGRTANFKNLFQSAERRRRAL